MRGGERGRGRERGVKALVVGSKQIDILSVYFGWVFTLWMSLLKFKHCAAAFFMMVVNFTLCHD